MDEIVKMQSYIDALFFFEACAKGEYQDNKEIALEEGKKILQELVEDVYKIGVKTDHLNTCKMVMDKVHEISGMFEDMFVIETMKEKYSSGEDEKENTEDIFTD